MMMKAQMKGMIKKKKQEFITHWLFNTHSNMIMILSFSVISIHILIEILKDHWD